MYRELAFFNGYNMKKFKGKNVYEVMDERFDFIFENFERVYLSFSGGKDSGVMLNLILDYMKRKNIKTKIGLHILDNEANYEYSLEFMHRMIKANLEYLDVYWCCLPITLPCTVSSYAIDWQCWGEQDKERWVRPMPDEEYIVNINNHNFDFFVENMNYDDFWDGFGNWYSQGKRTASLIGIRADESLNRFRAIMNLDKEILKDKMWTKKNSEFVYNVYPIYDWKVKDIWTVNQLKEWNYNKLYDVFYKAGVPVGKMRVASPFMSESKSSLGLYRVIDPHTWARLCARVGGANFVATYGKQLSYNSITLPNGHTWKSFVEFLLATLPTEVKKNFKSKFEHSIKFWSSIGRGLSEEIIEGLEENNIEFSRNGYTPHGNKNLERIIIKKIPDHLDFLKSEKGSVISWKRFALTILKNDHTCKYLGYAQNKYQMERQREITKKYYDLNKKVKGENNDRT